MSDERQHCDVNVPAVSFDARELNHIMNLVQGRKLIIEMAIYDKCDEALGKTKIGRRGPSGKVGAP